VTPTLVSWILRLFDAPFSCPPYLLIERSYLRASGVSGALCLADIVLFTIVDSCNCNCTTIVVVAIERRSL